MPTWHGLYICLPEKTRVDAMMVKPMVVASEVRWLNVGAVCLTVAYRCDSKL